MNQQSFQQALRRLVDHRHLSGTARRALESLIDDNMLGTEKTDPVEVVPASQDASPTVYDADAGAQPVDTWTEAPSRHVSDDNPFRREKTHSVAPFNTSRSHLTLGRFQNLGLVGYGGMGEVYRVRDRDLNRRMVLKVLRRELLHDSTAIMRFIEEAQLTSQLHHPGIVPVHELGVLDDGRLFFTMREVRGRTFREVIDDAHRAYQQAPDDEKTWALHFQGLMDIFQRVCEPLAYAHSRGIIHRDLKPANIMVGDFGEVQLLDWGLAKVVGEAEEGPGQFDEDFGTLRDHSTGFSTHRGSIVGTPAYMPPEQARGALEDLGPRSDVYALGIILYLVLDGEPPFQGPNAAAILFQVIEGIEHPPGKSVGAPQALIDLCMRATSLDPADRPANAGKMAEAISSWRDGSHRRKQALDHIQSADHLIPKLENLREQAGELRRKSQQRLRQISPSAPIEKKRPAWSLAEEADLLERQASTYHSRVIQHLESALGIVPELEEAHNRLAELYRREHVEAERRRDLTRAASLEVFIRSHNTGKFDDYLAGIGQFRLHTRPPGARVDAYRHVEKDRRLIGALKRRVGHTPIGDVDFPMGSYLMEITAAGRATVRYPVFIGRQEVWTGAPNGRQAPYPIRLPFEDELSANEIYVPGSYYWRGGDPQAPTTEPQSVVWVDPFLIQRDPVTHGEYLAFLNDLVDRGEIDRAEQHCPRETDNLGKAETQPIYLRDHCGAFLAPRENPKFLELPVNLITWHDARAYAGWYSHQTGRRWRLPGEDEWEKAARGVDGRFYPWGDYFDPNWCNMTQSNDGIPRPQPIASFPDDRSPYGVRGMAGNVRDWCAPCEADGGDDPEQPNTVPVRGGCWFSTAAHCRLVSREFKPPRTRSIGTGFRLVRSYTP